jgi:hypothetical protein
MARETVRPAVSGLEGAPNPRVIRVNATVELTPATIEKCPPASPPKGLPPCSQWTGCAPSTSTGTGRG